MTYPRVTLTFHQPSSGMTPQNRFWVGLTCAAIVVALSAWGLFGAPAMGLAPRPGIWARFGFGLAVSLLVRFIPIPARMRRRID
jgi:hypothetical protein